MENWDDIKHFEKKEVEEENWEDACHFEEVATTVEQEKWAKQESKWCYKQEDQKQKKKIKK